MENGVSFSRLPTGAVFLVHGHFYRKIKPVEVGYTRRMQTRYHNCIGVDGRTRFLFATLATLPVTFEDVRADSGNGRLLFRYAAEYGLIEIKPKGEELPLLVQLAKNAADEGNLTPS